METQAPTEPASTDRPAAATSAVARNAFNLVLGQVASTALAIFLNAALARILGAADFGLYFLLTTTNTFAFVFIEWGQPLFVIREVARQPSRASALLGSALAARAAFTVLVAGVAFLVTHLLGYDLRTQTLAALLILASLPLYLSQGYGMVFRARDQMGRDAMVSVTHKALAFVVSIAALRFGAGIPGVILAQAVAGLAALGLAFWIYRRLRAGTLTASMAVARELLSEGTPILAMTAAIAAQPYLDAVILSKLVPANVMGWFGAAKTILGTLITPAAILGSAAYPSLARASSDPASLRAATRSALRPLLWLGALASTGTYLFAGFAIGLIYGTAKFGPAATVLEYFAPAILLLFIDTLLGNVIYAAGRGTGFAIAKIASVGLGVLFNLAFIPVFQERYGNGGIGVMVAFALTEVVVFAGCVAVLRRGVFEFGMAIDLARAVGSGLLTLALFRVLPTLPPFLGLPLCVLAFTGFSWALGLVRQKDIALFKALLRRPKGVAPPAPEAGP